MYAEELTPEDIFNMFFGIPPGGRRPPAERQHRSHQSSAAISLGLFQLLPLIVLMMASLFSSLALNEDRVYSLKPMDGFLKERRTLTSGVRYWVRRAPATMATLDPRSGNVSYRTPPSQVPEYFELLHKDAVTFQRIEEEVESSNLNLLRKRCNAERAQKKMMIDAANQHGPDKAKMLERAERMHMRYCKEKDRLDALRR